MRLLTVCASVESIVVSCRH